MNEKKKSFDYDVGLWRSGMLIEAAACSILCAAQVRTGRDTTLDETTLSLCKGRSVLVCGSYYSSRDVAHLSAIATGVTLWVYDPREKDKYIDVCRTMSNPFADAIKTYPWLLHIVRRQPGLVAEKAQPVDEHFYRGFMKGVSGDDFVGAVTAAMAKSDPSTFEAHCIEVGENIAQVQEDDASELVRVAGRMITIGKYSACLVVGSAMPVMPAVIAAAGQADVGINMRFNAKDGATNVTFYTKKDGVDLGFVDQPPYAGGGGATCKGMTRKQCYLKIPNLKFEEVFDKD